MTSLVNLRVDHKRYFANPCELDPSALARYATNEWLEHWIVELTTRLSSRQVKKSELEDGKHSESKQVPEPSAGPYTGCGGIGFALLKAAHVVPEKLASSVQTCNDLINAQMATSKGSSRSRKARYLCGNLGLYVIQAISDHMAGRSIDQFKLIFAKYVDVVCTSGYQRTGDDDVLNGRSGFLLGVQMVKNETGQDLLRENDLKRVVDALVESGREYAAQHDSSAPLFYEWHSKDFWHLLDASQQSDVKQTLDWFVSIQSPNGNFPSSTGYIGYPKGEDELVHWCHGAPGVIHLLITALTLFNEEQYLQSAKRCADLIWHRGLLRKGPGLCHGLAGNGYGLLMLSRVVDDPVLVMKAKAFAVVMMDPNFESLANVPDAPYSLFEGWAGALCFLVDLINPVRAQFPLVPTKLAG